MKNIFPAKDGLRRLPRLALALGLLAGPLTAAAQTAPAVIYGLGTATQAFAAFSAGQQALFPLYPANLQNNSALYGNGIAITGVTAGQQLVGIDARPSTSQLYALGYNATTGAAQLYIINTTTGAASAVNSTPITLNLQDPDRANTRGFIPNVGFDFNPRADRLRVVAPNGVNYRLNPNTGGLVATDTPLSYAAGSNVGHAPYIGTAAYTNSAVMVAGTTLYDIDVTNTNALLSTQTNPNGGILDPVNKVTFMTNGNGNYYPLTSPTIGLDLDIAYDRSSSSNLAYLVEARYSDVNNTDINNKAVYPGGTTNRFSSNLWAFNLATGQAVGRNIFGQVPIFLSNIATMSSLQLVWTGAVSSDWQTAGNWYPNKVPTATDDVFIAGTGTVVGPGLTVANQPIITTAAPVAHTVTLDNDAVLTTATGGLLSVAGDFINNGATVAGSGTGTIALAGTGAQDIGGSTASTFQNLSVNSSATATTSAPASVQRALTVTGSLAIGSGQAFTLLSSASGQAYVVNVGSGAVTGTATVQRYIDPSINPGLGYRHYSAPVSNTTLADLATSTFAPVFNAAYNSSATPGTTRPYPTVFGYSQAQYESSPASSATPDFDKGYYSPASGGVAWVPGTGYTVNLGSNELVDFNGLLTNGNVTTAGQGRSAKANAGWQLLGNPYPSALDWNQVAASGLNGVDDAVYVFKSTGQYSGYYAAYVNRQGTSGGTNVIPVGQGFFVRTSAGSTGSLNFTNAQRITTDATAPFQRTAADTRPQLLLELSNGTAASQTDIYFQSGATASFDKAYDAVALPFLNGLVLASESGAEVLAINGQPALAGTVTVPLQVAAATAGTYTLRAADLANLPAGYHAYLRDGVLNTYTDLAATPSITLSLPATPAPGRFAVVFATAAPLATAPAALAALVGVYPSPAHGTATLVLPQALRGTGSSTVQLLNSLGQAVLTRTVAASSPDAIELPLTGLAAGIYTLRATTAAGQVAKRLVVQ